jgi:hypothetical protein
MNCRCFLALLFFIKLVAAVSGTIVQADHYADRGNLPAECYTPSGNMSFVTEDTVWKPPWLKAWTWHRYSYNFKFPITTDMNTDLKLDNLKFCILFLLFTLWFSTCFSTKIACDLCIFFSLLETRENMYANPKYLRYTQHVYMLL